MKADSDKDRGSGTLHVDAPNLWVDVGAKAFAHRGLGRPQWRTGIDREGDSDIMAPSVNNRDLARRIPVSQWVLQDAGHGGISRIAPIS